MQLLLLTKVNQMLSLGLLPSVLLSAMREGVVRGGRQLQSVNSTATDRGKPECVGW